MKICILSIDFLPNIGGIASHVYELARALVDNGDEVHIICLRTRGQEEFETVDGINIHRVYRSDTKVLGSLMHRFAVIRKILSLNSKIKLDVVHSHTIYDSLTLSLLSPFSSLPLVSTEHSSGFLIDVDNNRKNRIRVYKRILDASHHIICPSDELRDYVIRIGIDPAKVTYISNGVDVTKFNPEAEGTQMRKKLGLGSQEKIVLCPRRLVPKNGVLYFIQAIPSVVAEMDDIKFLVAGDGSELEKLRNEARKLNIEDNVIFLGSVPNDEMPELYNLSSVVVLPSLKEATSISGLEAMASAKPLIGSDIGGIPQIIDDGQTGFLVPPERADLIASSLISLFKDEERRVSMGKNAYQKAKNEFTWGIIAEKTRRVYEMVITGR